MMYISVGDRFEKSELINQNVFDQLIELNQCQCLQWYILIESNVRDMEFTTMSFISHNLHFYGNDFYYLITDIIIFPHLAEAAATMRILINRVNRGYLGSSHIYV